MAHVTSITIVLSILLQFLFNNGNVFAFSSNLSVRKVLQKQKDFRTTQSMVIDDNDNINNVSSRKDFMTKITAISATSVILGPRKPAFAIFRSGLEKANTLLDSYGLPKLSSLPDGFSPLVEIYGKGKNREPLLVEFLYPTDWVSVLPSNDMNSEEGTIQVGQYAAGDTATLFVTPGKVEDVTARSKSFFEELIIKAISQRGGNMYQNFKLTKLEPLTGEYKDQKYAIVTFKYELLTQAGFTVDRNGVASVSSEGSNTQVFWAASTRQRYKKTEKNLRTIVNSFRCFSDGIQVFDELT